MPGRYRGPVTSWGARLGRPRRHHQLWPLRALTVLPASLLCLFMAERASGRFSRASANSRDTSTPKSASSLHPPHFQPSPGGPLWWESQPQMVDVPSAQERVTAKATPADAMAWTKADSRVAADKQSHRVIGQGNTFIFLPNPLQHHLNLIKKQKKVVILLIF